MILFTAILPREREEMHSSIQWQTNCYRIFYLLLLCNIISPLFGHDINSYRAAVLELVQSRDPSVPYGELIRQNLDVFEIATKTAYQHDVDIIVFPECGIYTYGMLNRSSLLAFVEDIPNLSKGSINPCLQFTSPEEQSTLKRLSCLAKNFNIFLVANLVDRKPCQVKNKDTCDKNEIATCKIEEAACPDDDAFLYNTNVVFNREGELIAKYYKKNLWFEFEMNYPKFEQDGFFETDFGNFTTVICFDLVFKDPIKDVQKRGVINVAYPAYSYDHLPLIFFATPYQQAWATVNKVNLLASNGHNPRNGTLGSGIFSASKGALIYSHNPDNRTKLLISNVPKALDGGNFLMNSKRFFIDDGIVMEGDYIEDRDFEKDCGMHVLGDTSESSTNYRCHPPVTKDGFKFVKLRNKKDAFKVCSGGFCCSIQYHANSMDEDYFLAVSGNDVIFYNTYSFGTETCFLARCETLGDQICSRYVLHSHTVFRDVRIEGTFQTGYVYPFAVDSEIRLTERKDWTYDNKSISYHNSNKVTSLVFLGLFGRMYEKDKVLY